MVPWAVITSGGPTNAGPARAPATNGSTLATRSDVGHRLLGTRPARAEGARGTGNLRTGRPRRHRELGQSCRPAETDHLGGRLPAMVSQLLLRLEALGLGRAGRPGIRHHCRGCCDSVEQSTRLSTPPGEHGPLASDGCSAGCGLVAAQPDGAGAPRSCSARTGSKRASHARLASAVTRCSWACS